MKNKNHPFHLVDKSPWPILGSLSMMIFFSGLLKWFHFNQLNLLLFSMTCKLLIMFHWWRDITREGTYQGHHTLKVTLSLRFGMILFIISEVLFLLSFFMMPYHQELN